MDSKTDKILDTWILGVKVCCVLALVLWLASVLGIGA